MADVTAFNWSEYAQKLPWQKDAASEAVRRKIFDACDMNGNGLISLAELDRGLREVLGSDVEQHVYSAKPAIMRAFQVSPTHTHFLPTAVVCGLSWRSSG